MTRHRFGGGVLAVLCAALLSRSTAQAEGGANQCQRLSIEIESMDLGIALRKAGASLSFLGNLAATAIHPTVSCQVARGPPGLDTCWNDFSPRFGNEYDYHRDDVSMLDELRGRYKIPGKELYSMDKERGVITFTDGKPWTLESGDAHGRGNVQCWVHTRYTRRYVLGVFRASLDMFSGTGGGFVAVPLRGIVDHKFGRDVNGDGVGHWINRQKKRFHEWRHGKAQLPEKVAWVKGHKYVRGPTVHFRAGEDVGSVRVRLRCMDGIKGTAPIPPRGASERGVRALFTPVAVRNPSARRDSLGPARAFVRPDGCPRVFAHRGVIDPASGMENSLEALTASRAAGVTGAEIDVYLTGAGLLVTHDKDLARQYAIDTRIKDIPDTNVARELEKVIGCPMFPMLDSFLKTAREADFLLNIELKPEEPDMNPFSGHAKQLGTMVGNAVRAAEMEERVIVSALDSAKLVHVNDGMRAGGKKIATALAEHSGFGGGALRVIEKLRRNAKSPSESGAAVRHYKLVDKEWVDKIHAEGAIAGAYTAYDLTELGGYAMDGEGNFDINRDTAVGDSFSDRTIRNVILTGVDFIETDDPPRLQDLIDAVCKPSGGDAEQVVSTTDSGMDGNKRIVNK